MAADPLNVSRLKSVTFATAALGYAQNVNISENFNDDPVQGEGNLTIDALLPTQKSCKIEADFLNNPQADPSAAPGTIVVTDINVSGADKFIQVTLMKPRGWASAHTVGGKTMYKQEFINVGAYVITRG